MVITERPKASSSQARTRLEMENEWLQNRVDFLEKQLDRAKWVTFFLFGWFLGSVWLFLLG